MEKPEFKIGKKVTLDRYNHVDDAEVVKVVGYGTIGWGDNERLAYKLDVKGTIITSTGLCIKESKNYVPCPEEDRHYKIGASIKEQEEHWDKKLNKVAKLFGRLI